MSFMVQRGERGCQADKSCTALLFFLQQCDLSHRSIEAALGAQAINSYLTWIFVSALEVLSAIFD